MIITYDKFPILGFLKGLNYPIKTLEGEETLFLDHIKSLCVTPELIRKSLLDNVTFVSKPYIKSIFRSVHSFKHLIENPEFSTSCGVLLHRSDEAKCYCAIVWYLTNQGGLRLYIFYDCDTLVGVIERHADGSISYDITEDEGLKGGFNDKALIVHTYHMFLGWYYMEKYAKVETVECNANSKIQNAIMLAEKKIINYTDVKVIFRDCSWFTTICRNEEFNVRGHFRLQPKKVNGEWTKELIYINEFKKHGYYRQAKILNNK